MINDDLKQQILQQANQAAPDEMCGLIYFSDGLHHFEPVENVADTPSETFLIAPDDWERVETLGEIRAVVHSHPQGLPYLSTADRQNQLWTGLPWVLAVGGELKVFPCVPKLLGRRFEYGVTDCFALASDAYLLAGISVPQPTRGLLEDDARNKIILNGIDVYGVTPVEGNLLPGDILLFSLGGEANHIGLYLGNEEFLHHANGWLSRREFFGETWQRCLHSRWRHPQFKPELIQAVLNDFEVV